MVRGKFVQAKATGNTLDESPFAPQEDPTILQSMENILDPLLWTLVMVVQSLELAYPQRSQSVYFRFE